jgi:hypothetical protein
MMHLNRKQMAAFLVIPIIGVLLYGGLEERGYASTGTEVFRGFTSHISEQIRRDKQDFFEAQFCISWLYDQMGKKPQQSGPKPEEISFHFASEPKDEFDCATRYPDGLEGLQAAREAFSNTQQSLSFTLTFFEFALVGDRDDDGQYNGGELRDVFESFGMNFEDRLPSDQYLVSLKGMFDNLRGTRELQPLVRSMEVLLEKGYRFTSADQEALNRELG